MLGWAVNSNAPAQKTNPASTVTKHQSQGKVQFNLKAAQNANFEMWKSWAAPKAGMAFTA
jgi:hypothetical protein